MRNYELYFIINPELTAEKTDKLIDNIQQAISHNLHVKDIQVQKEGVKKLAYPIKKQWTGFYVSFIFDVADKDTININTIEKVLNLETNIVRHLIINLDHFNKLKSKENLNKTDIKDHREFNKGKKKNKCFVKHLGLKDFDYKDIEFLNQFTSPYAKIFSSSKTGTSAKYQRKLSKAIKRARHMALMPFTTKHFN
ncbi:30S ribosomal protein S18 [Candidatus Gracilibacteria bacterium]|nr:30S ribosomal protein S18 [Thermales bacterium]NJS40809.1 30S ribosomal protein S18 [Candidatus Gracilibacteria bacterium]